MEKNQNDWINSDWYKELEHLSYEEYDDNIVRDGYWCYDNVNDEYKYIKIL